MKGLIWAAAFAIFTCAGVRAQGTTSLSARGYTVIPEPQAVVLKRGHLTFGRTWRLKLGAGVAPRDNAVQALRRQLTRRDHVVLRDKPRSQAGALTLRIQPGAVRIGKAEDRRRAALAKQAYRIALAPHNVTITANAPAGLFYGVETFVQLIKPESGKLRMPIGEITDWPNLGLRAIFWDDNFHLDRMRTLKRVLRRAAFYKINAVVLKLNGHFDYKNVSTIVDAHALSPSQYQELTDYGLAHQVQLIPYIDGPAHSAYILKYAKFHKLREFPDNNTEFCATDPGTYKLLETMYKDILDANKGVKYFFVSTDEPYYVGTASDAQCDSMRMKRRLGTVGQVEIHFLKKTAGYLHSHGRSVIFWGEFPLKPSDVAAIPKYLIDGEVDGAEFARAFHERGIPQLIYTPSQGSEALFPHYFKLPSRHWLIKPRTFPSRIQAVLARLAHGPALALGNVIGNVDAAWGDSGLNAETFWLGYVASAEAAWHPDALKPAQFERAFYKVFYGSGAIDMDRLYRMMSDQAQIYGNTFDPNLWNNIPAFRLKGLWGWSYGRYVPQRLRESQSVSLPPTPLPDLAYDVGHWSRRNTKRVGLAKWALWQNTELLALIKRDESSVQFNRYNLEVYASIAELCRQDFQFILGLAQINKDLGLAAKYRGSNPPRAVAMVDNALDLATWMWASRNRTLKDVVAVWSAQMYPRASAARGRQVQHALNDVHDYVAGRTSGMTYLVDRETGLPFGTWVDAIAKARNAFASQYSLPLRKYNFDWRSFTVPLPVH